MLDLSAPITETWRRPPTSPFRPPPPPHIESTFSLHTRRGWGERAIQRAISADGPAELLKGEEEEKEEEEEEEEEAEEEEGGGGGGGGRRRGRGRGRGGWWRRGLRGWWEVGVE